MYSWPLNNAGVTDADPLSSWICDYNLYSQLSISTFLYPRIQPTVDHAVLQYLRSKNIHV